MDLLFNIRDSLRYFYAKNSGIVQALSKLVCAFLCFMILGLYMGDLATELFSVNYLLLFSLICAFLPWGSITFFSGVLILICMLESSYIMATVMLICMLLICVLYFGFKPGHGVVLAAVCMAYILKIQFIVPLILALSIGAGAAVPCALGVFMWFVLKYYVDNAAGMSTAIDTTVMTSELSSFVDGVVKDRYMLICVVAFALCVLIVSAVKNLSIDHSWTIAIGAGAVVLSLLIILIGAAYAETSLLWDLFGIVVSLLLAFIYECVFFGVDYSGAEKIQFEDDDYYYYVKAIPKLRSDDDERHI